MNPLSIIQRCSAYFLKRESIKLFNNTLSSSNNQKMLVARVNLSSFLLSNSKRNAENFSLVTKTRNFSTSVNKKAIPPLLWVFLKPLTKLGAILAGRGFRKWWTSLPKVKKQIFMDHLKRNRSKYGLGITITSGSFFAFYQSHVAYTPITHRKRFILFKNYQLEDIESIEKENVI